MVNEEATVKQLKFLFLFIFLLVEFVFPQTNSFYSGFGIGIPDYSYSARRFGMGELGVAIEDKEFISVLNPASWKNIDLTRIEFGTTFSFLFAKDNSDKKFYSNNYFSGFALAFPLSVQNGIALSFGLTPYTRSKYEVLYNYEDITDANNNYKIDIYGSGGLSKLYVGSSYSFPFDLSIGASLDYYFGELKNSSSIAFNNSNNGNALFYTVKKMKGIGSTVGLISPDLNKVLFNISGIKDIRLGLTFNLSSDMTIDTSFVKKSVYFEDTVKNGNTKFTIPIRITGGLAMKIGNFYQVYFDYMYQPWKDFKYAGTSITNLRNGYKLSSGFEYKIPDSRDYWDMIAWRFGLSYENLPFQVNGENINQFSVSGGFSLPLSKANTIDVGLQYISRGSNNSGLTKENIFRLNLGISLADLWFFREEK